MSTNAHIASLNSSDNTFGVTMDVMLRPNLSEDLRTNDLLRTLLESFMVIMPKETQNAIEDSIVAAIAAVDGKFAGVNFIRISTDAGNKVRLGADEGLYMPGNRYAEAATEAVAGTTIYVDLNLPGFEDTNYQINVEYKADPGVDSRWWVITKAPNQARVAIAATNSVACLVSISG